MAFTSHHPVFITLTCLEWNWFLKHDTCKRISIDALLFRVFRQDVEVYGFVIMPNHVHLIWRVADHLTLSDFQRDFLKYTAKGILVQLRVLDTTLYEKTKVNFKDRSRQIWERNSLSKEIYTESFFLQKLDYIHNNLLQEHWHLAKTPEEYRWSSASFYNQNHREWFFIKDYRS